MTDLEAGMAEVLDLWVQQGRLASWDGLTIEVQDDGKVVVSYNVHPPFDVVRLRKPFSVPHPERIGNFADHYCADGSLTTIRVGDRCGVCGHPEVSDA